MVDTTVPDTTGPETTVPDTTVTSTTVAGVVPTTVDNGGPGSGVQSEGSDQTTPGATTSSTPGGVTSGTLPRTGSNPAPWVLAGSTMVLVGLVLMGLGNRKRLAEG